MLRSSLLALCAPLGLAMLLLSTAGTASSQEGSLIDVTLSGPIDFEPILIHDVVGGTLTGAIHTHLTVYSSGFATVAKLHDQVFPAEATDMEVATASLTPAEVKDLRRALEGSGAFGLFDQQGMVTDVPLATTTVFQGGTNARAHSYSYMLAQGDYQAPQAVVDELMQAHFPGF